MPEANRPTADEVMAAAAAEFLAVARAALDTFDGLGDQLQERPDAVDLLQPFRQELHRLNGSAATFGYARAGRMAAAMEAVVRKWIDAPELDRARRASVVANFARVIRAHLAVGGEAPRVPGRRLIIVGVRDALGVGLTAEGAARGYLVERVTADEIEDALEEGAPFAMIALAPAPTHQLLASTVTIELRPDDAVSAVADDHAHVQRLPASTAAAEVLDTLEMVATAERAAVGTVLVLDDDPVMRTVVGVAATQVNLVVHAVADVEDFRAAIEGSTPAVIVTDIELGAVSGVDLVREVRARLEYRSVPVLILSARGDDATRQAALDAGASDYLLKPVSMPVLAAKLAAWHAHGAR